MLALVVLADLFLLAGLGALLTLGLLALWLLILSQLLLAALPSLDALLLALLWGLLLD